MNENKKPNTNIYLPREIFNSLITALTYFTALEINIGETFFSKHAKRLKEKILKYSRVFDNKNGDMASIKFYEIESAVLIKLLIYYIALGENPNKDYFEEIEKR